MAGVPPPPPPPGGRGDPQQPDPGAGLLNAIRNAINGTSADAALNDKVNVLRARREAGLRRANTDGEPVELTPNQELLSSLLITAANGDYDLPRQAVNVEYLKNDQRLLIPAPLGFHPTNMGESESRVVEELYQRYIRAALTPYPAIRNAVMTATSYAQIRGVINATQIPNPIDLTGSWIYERVPTLADGTPEARDQLTLIVTTLSHALQLNCDIRDIGFMLREDTRVTDTQWSRYNETTIARLRQKLHPLTAQTVAALNYANVAQNALAAWIRAFGLSTGILPSRDSLSQIEYQFTYAQPTAEARQAVAQYESRVSFQLHSVCMNFIAMFGLLHLAKDHTYKSNDPNMERICTSWIMTIRTMVTNDDMEYMRGNLESLCRTAAHPFGLAQTYWLAKSMANLELLSSPLMKREDVTPPPVQRVMIVRAAVREWESLPSGQQLNRMYRAQLDIIEKEYDTIMQAPTSYSGLHRLYGQNAMATLTREAKDACDSMMPMVYGFSLAMHTDETNKKDGLALALSLLNVERDNKVLSKSYEAIWHNYLDKVAKTGLMEFVTDATTVSVDRFGRVS